MTTITQEILKRFCATKSNDPREYLYAPMLIEGWLCATNGHVVVGIPPTGADDATPAAPAPIIKKGISSIRQMWEQVTADQWRPWTDLNRCSQTPPTCDCCQGSGWVTVTQCNHCDGEGKFRYLGLYYECKNCNEEGVHWYPATSQTTAAMPCQICDGHGAVWSGLVATMPGIQHYGLQERYATLLQDYPGIEWAPPRHSGTDCGAIPIRFNGGWGAVMPYRIQAQAKAITEAEAA